MWLEQLLFWWNDSVQKMFRMLMKSLFSRRDIMTKDMTSGNLLKLIIGFAIPMFLGMLFQQFYSMVDT